MTSRSRLIILALALAGIGVSGYATWVHHKLLTDASYISPCDINATVNCSEVYLSPYGAVKGIPVAIGGVIWFGLAALIALFADTSSGKAEERASGAYLFALSTIGLAVVLSLAYTSVFVLKHVCPLCVATYVCVIGIFITAGTTSSVPVLSLPGRLFRDLRDALSRPAQMTAGGVYLAAIVALIMFFPANATSGPMTTSAAPPKLENASAVKTNAEGAQDLKTQLKEWMDAQPRVETGVPLKGAKVVIVKFSDFQCPGCKQTWLMYKPVIEKYQPEQVRYVMKDFPLQPQCNVAVQQQIHPFACDAAVAYRAAAERGKGPEMEQWIFDNQAALTAASIRDNAKRIAGILDFDKEIALRTPGIKKDTADGGALQINSTPTFFINGVKLPTAQWLNPDAFELVIQIELERAGVAAPQKAGGE